MIRLGPIVKPRQQSLGSAMAVAGKPQTTLQRPINHWKTQRPPTMEYRKNHPMLTKPAINPAMPVRTTRGVSQNQLSAYVKALQRGV